MGENADSSRRTELRRVAQTRVKADVKAAKVAIETASATIQEQLLVGGLRSDEAKALLETIPSVESLMPPLPTAEIIEIEEANGKRRGNWQRRQLPALEVPTDDVTEEQA